jgi:SPP1 gp7 family putative phage head morphogenesis protein
VALNVDQALQDALISYQLDLRRLEAGTRQRVLAIFDIMQRELTSAVASKQLTAFSAGRKKELLRQVDKIIKNYYQSAQRELDLDIEGLAEAQARHTARIIEGTAVVNTAVALPTAAELARISREVLIEGGPMGDWWSRMASGTSFSVSNAIRQGIVQGENNAQVISRITGSSTTIGALTAPRHNVAAIVQTSMQTVANDSRMSVFEANTDIIKELKWFSAMDGHVCPKCIALSGRVWKNTEDHEPVGHVVPFRNPPIHWNDRCVLLPVTKTFRELGVDLPEVPEGMRASKYGPISSKTTFDEFLKRQPKAQQDEQLGAGRAQLWRDGKITLAQLIDGKGRELTLAELKRKYD